MVIVPANHAYTWLNVIKEPCSALVLREFAWPGGEFLWLLIQHVLPRRFRRVRDYGLLHSLPKQLVQLLQLLLRVVLPPPVEPRPRPPVCCPHCDVAMPILAVRVKHQPLLKQGRPQS